MLEKITSDNIIDTNNTESLEKYKNNLELLIKETKEKGYIDKFALIRNDDFFPYNSEWIVNSENTNGEERLLVRYSKNKPTETKKKGIFSSLFGKKQEPVNLSDLEFESIKLYYPVEFRSTKHFTVNTALGTTGEYNLVNSNRKFTIIDGIDNFINSGYGYSLSERDAYLDVTHEPLKISDSAIVLVSVSTYNEIKEDRELLEQISNKRLIIYKGDVNKAINMILTENGILPTRCEIEYDDELNNIITNSFKQLCINNNLEYDRPHGMTGHFTSYIDQYSNTTSKLEKEFIEFLNNKLVKPVMDNNDNIRDLKQKIYAGLIPVEDIKPILEEFNSIKKLEIENRREQYLEDRKSITPEISKLFKDTIKLIREHENEISFLSYDSDLSKVVFNFFVAPSVNEQVMYANEINKYFNEYSNEPAKQH